MTAHEPTRPDWMCEPCAAPWPCDPERVRLAEEYAADRVGLSMRMGVELVNAARDTRGDPGELFERFVSWTR